MGVFFNTWADLGRVALVGVLAYIGLVLMLRISGKRTLSKMNAFDLVVTVALGSTLATILLSREVALFEGLVAFLVLIMLQYIVAWSSLRLSLVRQMVKSEPSLLLFQGQYLDKTLKTQRVTRAEVLAAIRSQGLGTLDEVEAVVLETNGNLSVVRSEYNRATSALEGVTGFPKIAGKSQVRKPVPGQITELRKR